MSNEITKIQEQQKLIANLLQNQMLLDNNKKMSKQMWTSILRSSGFSDEEMRNWHVTFEREAPDQHEAFLKYLQLSDDEIDEIRCWSAKFFES